MRQVRCPTEDLDPGPSGPIKGCGLVFEVSPRKIAEDPDGYVDCPGCGLFFDPDNPYNQPQPERGDHAQA